MSVKRDCGALATHLEKFLVVGAVSDLKNVWGKSDESRYSAACLYGMECDFEGSICRAEGDEARGADVDVVCHEYLMRTDDDDVV